MENVFQTITQVIERLNTAAREIAACVEVIESIKYDLDQQLDKEHADLKLVDQFMKEDGDISTDPEFSYAVYDREEGGECKISVETSVDNLDDIIRDSIESFLKWQREQKGGTE